MRLLLMTLGLNGKRIQQNTNFEGYEISRHINFCSLDREVGQEATFLVQSEGFRTTARISAQFLFEKGDPLSQFVQQWKRSGSHWITAIN